MVPKELLHRSFGPLFISQKRPDFFDVIISLGGKEVFPETLIQVAEDIKANKDYYQDEMLWL